MKESKTEKDLLDDFYGYLERCYEAEELEKIERFLINYEKRLLESKRKKGMLVAVYNEQGSFCRSAGRYHDSIKAFQKAQNEIVCCLGTACTEYAALLNNLAGTYRLAGWYDKAAESFNEAIQIYCGLGEEESFACANVHSNLSLLYQESGKTESAVRHLKRALELIKGSKDHRQETVVILSNLTALYHKAGNNSKAMWCMEQALQTFETYCDMKNTRYSAALNSLGGFLCGIGEYQRAVRIYVKAADYTMKFFGRNIEYVNSCQNMYWAYQNMGEEEKAVQALTAASKACLQLFGPEHDHTRTVQKLLQYLQKNK